MKKVILILKVNILVYFCNRIVNCMIDGSIQIGNIYTALIIGHIFIISLIILAMIYCQKRKSKIMIPLIIFLLVLEGVGMTIPINLTKLEGPNNTEFYLVDDSRIDIYYKTSPITMIDTKYYINTKCGINDIKWSGNKLVAKCEGSIQDSVDLSEYIEYKLSQR